jgi:hypothetical protein
MDRIYIVFLRQPRKKDPNEMRSDPFWEFGSFGLTGCHSKNLMRPERKQELDGSRLAFFQGGPKEIKLIMLTPPIELMVRRRTCEALWDPLAKPINYAFAPLVIDNQGNTDLPMIKDMVAKVNRGTWMGRIGSAFRTTCQPLPDEAARQMAKLHDIEHRYSPKAYDYYLALPYLPPKIDPDRRQTFAKLKKEKSTCKPRT